LLKPGFLSGEYIIGRRSRYLNPIKMYVFISAFFFLFFFSLIQPSFDTDKAEAEQPTYTEVKTKIEERIENLETNLKDEDNAEFLEKTMAKHLELLQQDIRTLAKDTTDLSHLNYFKLRNLSVPFGEYRDLAQYDSVQNALPAKDRDNWVKKVTAKKGIQLQLKYGDNGMEFFKTLREKFQHWFPQLFFISLPLFALLLKLLYIRKKSFYFVDHVIFTVHLYCAMFLMLFILLSISQLEHLYYLKWLQYFTLPLTLYLVWYPYKSLRNFYDQTRIKTISKYLLLLIMSWIVMSLLFVVFLVFSVFNL
ncbi:MAG TPA: DUF3667 domain-containing protein, partial [Segetibacter sp.]|nr:DUF3667 domain-containing protein [Segetibacter sp.]